MNEAPKTPNSLSSNVNEIIVRINNEICFTAVQIENVLKIQLSNMNPQNCVSLVSSTLGLNNIEENNVHFWLADTLTMVVKNIQRMRMNVLQGITVVCWVIYFISLVVDERLCKTELFHNLRESIKSGLKNVDRNVLPFLPNGTEYPKYSTSVLNVRKKLDDYMPVTTEQMVAVIISTIHEVFWDDFKYTVIQMAFNTDPIQVKKMEYSIRDVDPLLQLQNNNNDEITNNNFKCHTIMNRYFLRGFRNTSLSVIEGLQQLLCSQRSHDISNVILPLSEAIVDEKYIENLCSTTTYDRNTISTIQ